MRRPNVETFYTFDANDRVMNIRSFVVLVFLALSMAACGETIRGNGEITSTSRELDVFEEINTSGVFEIELAVGRPKVEIEADDNLHEYVLTEVKNGVLHVHSSDKHLIAKKLKLVIFCEGLKALDISGAAEIKSRDELKGETFTLSISGAGEAELGLNVDQLNLEISGGGDLDLGGRAGVAEIEVSGAGQIDALPLHVNRADIEVTGAGEIRISVEESLNVDITGAGEVSYAGNPEVTKNITGAGELKQLKDEH